MEKLSGIIPSSARVKSVDMSDAKPVRPGAPSFGGPVGENSTKDKVSFMVDRNTPRDSMLYKNQNPKEASRAKMVEEINKRFFDSRLNKPTDETAATAAVNPQTGELESTALAPEVSPLGKNVEQQLATPRSSLATGFKFKATPYAQKTSTSEILSLGKYEPAIASEVDVSADAGVDADVDVESLENG